MKILGSIAKQQTNGFTLVELIITVTIIAVLTSTGLAIYSGVSKNSQNTKKKADIDAIYQSYELNYDISTKKYKALTDSDFTSGKMPAPYGGGSYTYVYGPNAPVPDLTKYMVCASFDPNVPACSAPSAYCYCRTSDRGN